MSTWRKVARKPRGANVLVAGTAVFGAKDYRAAVRDLRDAAERGRA